jgi:hypothetical protein
MSRTMFEGTARFLSPTGTVFHATRRWAGLVAGAVGAPADPRTLSIWARVVGVSLPVVRHTCYAARRSPRTSLAFTRLLRAVLVAQETCWHPHEILDIVDTRTRRRLLERGGLQDQPEGELPSFVQFVNRQTLVADDLGRAAILDALGLYGTEYMTSVWKRPQST